MRRVAAYVWCLAVLFAATGASCPINRPPAGQPPPVAFARPPTLPEIVQTINAQTDRVYQLHTDAATLTIPGAPALRASLALQRPRNFRLRAHFVGLGQVLDIGSNDERFWVLVDAPQLATNVPRAVYFARHDQFRQGAAGKVLPIEPQRLVEAFGLLRLDPAEPLEGPYRRGPGQLEIRARVPGPEGDLTRVLVLHETYGWVLEQHLYDPQGKLLGSALASNQRYYPNVGVSLPHQIEIRLPPPAEPVRIDVQNYTVNQLYGDPNQLWTMPAFTGYTMIDLGTPAASPPPAGMPPNPQAPATAPPSAYPAMSYRPRYRGYTSQQ